MRTAREQTGPIFGPKGNPTAANLFKIIACLQQHEGVRLQVVAQKRFLFLVK